MMLGPEEERVARGTELKGRKERLVRGCDCHGSTRLPRGCGYEDGV